MNQYDKYLPLLNFIAFAIITISQRVNAMRNKQTMTKLNENSEKLNEVHTLVNGASEAAQKKIEGLQEEVRGLKSSLERKP